VITNELLIIEIFYLFTYTTIFGLFGLLFKSKDIVFLILIKSIERVYQRPHNRNEKYGSTIFTSSQHEVFFVIKLLFKLEYFIHS
jgi:hypothetical protein